MLARSFFAHHSGDQLAAAPGSRKKLDRGVALIEIGEKFIEGAAGMVNRQLRLFSAASTASFHSKSVCLASPAWVDIAARQNSKAQLKIVAPKRFITFTSPIASDKPNYTDTRLACSSHLPRLICRRHTNPKDQVGDQPGAPQKTKTRNRARQSHAGIGVCSPKPPHTPAIFLSVEDFLRLRTLSQKSHLVTLHSSPPVCIDVLEPRCLYD